MIEKQLLGQLSANAADILKDQLSKVGVEVVTIFNAVSCQKGCTPSKEVWAHPDDVAFIREFMEARYYKTIQEMGADPEIVHQVFDPAKSTARCPACGAYFATTESVCPECELVIMPG